MPDTPDYMVVHPRIGAGRQFCYSAFWFATNLQWMALLQIIIPLQMKQITPAGQARCMGIILGLGALVSGIVPPIVGQFSDRCTSRLGRRRPYMIGGAAINAVGLSMLWLAGTQRSLAMYIVGFLVLQFGNNIATASYSGIIPDLVPESQRGTASGWMAAMNQTGMIFGALFGGILMQAGKVFESFLALIVTIVLFMAITVAGAKEQPLNHRPARQGMRAILTSFWIDPRKHPNFAWVWLTRFLFTLGMWTVQPFLQWYMRDVVRASNPVICTAILMVIALIGATVTGIIGGALSDRIGRKPVIYVANGLMALSGLGFLANHSLVYTFIIAAVYGLGLGAYTSVDWALGCDVLPNKDEAAKDMGVWHISMVLPQSIAPMVGGAVLGQYVAGHITEGRDVIELYTLGGYTLLFIIAAIFLLVSALLLRNVKGVR